MPGLQDKVEVSDCSMKMEPVSKSDEDGDEGHTTSTWPSWKIVSGTRADSARFFHDRAQPALKEAQAFTHTNPVLSLFIATFVILSSVPVLCFAGTSLFIIGTLLFASLACSVVVGAAIITVLGMALLGTLFIISFFSIFLTLFAIGAFLAFRLVFLLRTQDSMREGVALWTSELKDHVYSRLVWGPAVLKQDSLSSAVFNSEEPNRNGTLDDESHKGKDETTVKIEQ